MLEEFVKPLRESIKLLSDLFMAIRASVASTLGVFEDVSEFRAKKSSGLTKIEHDNSAKLSETSTQVFVGYSPVM